MGELISSSGSERTNRTQGVPGVVAAAGGFLTVLGPPGPALTEAAPPLPSLQLLCADSFKERKLDSCPCTHPLDLHFGNGAGGQHPLENQS